MLTAGMVAASRVSGRDAHDNTAAAPLGARLVAERYSGPEESPIRAPAEASVEGVVITERPGSAVDPPPVCIDSYDPTCAAFHWVSPIYNAPVRIAVHVSTRDPAVGESFDVSVEWSDADADSAVFDLKACDAMSFCTDVGGQVTCRGTLPSGPWNPPPTQPGSGQFSATVTLPSIGPWVLKAKVDTYSSGYVAWAEGRGGLCVPEDPYRSVDVASSRVVVSRLEAG